MDQPNLRLSFQRLTGADIETVFEPLAMLRIAVFRDFPYLYEGNIAYERTYLNTYCRSERAMLLAVYDGEQLVGATTCIPLSDETTAVISPFEKAGWDISRIVYFGESILLPAYRGQGVGHRFFDEREQHAANLEGITHTCFCAVERPNDHPSRPVDYRPLDAFWNSRGYQKAPALVASFDWPDIGEAQSTSKKMIYWMRALPVRS